MHSSSLKLYFHEHFAWLGLFFLVTYLWKVSGIGWLPGFSDHLSNFSLTGVLSLLIIGPRAFGLKNGQLKLFAVSAFFVLANLIVEVISGGTLGGFNVLDIYDALYGILASVVVIVAHFLIATQKGRGR